VADGIRLWVRLTPRARREGCDGLVEIDGRTCLKLRVAAPPVDGAANAALCRFLSRALGCAKSAVSIESGETARIKRLRVTGEPTALEQALRRLIAG